MKKTLDELLDEVMNVECPETSLHLQDAIGLLVTKDNVGANQELSPGILKQLRKNVFLNYEQPSLSSLIYFVPVGHGEISPQPAARYIDDLVEKLR